MDQMGFPIIQAPTVHGFQPSAFEDSVSSCLWARLLDFRCVVNKGFGLRFEGMSLGRLAW